jgi:hypothetical protein
LYLTGILLTAQLIVLLSPPGPRDAEGLVKGHDFSHFYTLGTIARAGVPWQLYDGRVLTETMWSVVPETRPDAFQPVYGPQVALAFAPLSALSYTRAVGLWLTISGCLYLAASAMTVRTVRGSGLPVMTLAVLLLASPAFNVLLVSGQTSAVALLAIVVAWRALVKGRPLVAGIALGVLAYKPSLLAGVVAVLTVAGEWRILAGIGATASAQLLVAAAWAGPETMMRYAEAVMGPARTAGMVVSQPQHLHSLAGFFRLLLGAGVTATIFYAVCALAVVILSAGTWRRLSDPHARIAVLVLATVLAAPHLYVYDLVILAPALAVIWARAESADGRVRTAGRAIAWLAWFMPLAGPIALVSGIQPSTPLLAAALAWLARSRRPEPIVSA